jgi:hypothetical protein
MLLAGVGAVVFRSHPPMTSVAENNATHPDRT